MYPPEPFKLFSREKIPLTWEDLMGPDLFFGERHIYVGSATYGAQKRRKAYAS